ncbi:DedA family protein [Rickettsiales endosymbiont of Peranema trichophorum]|uniref:DedA family protein n=1 Tax=Rickettsiales endosymbiont of Peranema trichophorum TaxID=2486577 RepID=UPI0010237284|nr:DedA family protein [Rickettsiales endosymbiont of Peranema trichophorum]RZI47418.1 DedA family protein [Rickettsiales endosymbiont of Peranema trichophorum]
MYDLFLSLVKLVEQFGYLGIFFMTFIESTFIPIPSEVTVIPAGFLVHKGEMNFWIVYLVCILGTVCGSILNYQIALHFGRMLLLRYGKYFFMSSKKLHLIESFFEKHGAISTFSGRLLPGIKHFISFPAGLGKMNFKLFITYTAAGGAIWNGLLVSLGYYIGENEHLIKQYMKQLNIVIVGSLSCLALYYYYKHRRNQS